MRLAESERRIMEVLWEHGDLTAREAAILLSESRGWKKTTTYTMLTRCEQKKYVKRTDPHFLCTPLISKKEVALWETETLLKDDFDGSAEKLVAMLVDKKMLSSRKLKDLLEDLKED